MNSRTRINQRHPLGTVDITIECMFCDGAEHRIRVPFPWLEAIALMALAFLVGLAL